jgi:purine-binding chemotaxis protein CheW
MNTEHESLAGQFLIVQLAERRLGIPLLRIADIYPLREVAPVLQAPDYTSGFMTVQGRTMPLADLRANFGLKCGLSITTRVVVVWLNLAEWQNSPIGLIVDGVDRVVTVNSTEIESAKPPATGATKAFLLGIARQPGGVLQLVDVDRLFEASPLRHATG